jgi:hypothetical protein
MEKDMKKDLSIIAKALFPDFVENTYEDLLGSYQRHGKTATIPTLSLNEAVSKYTHHVLNVIENRDNWKTEDSSIFVDFHDFFTIFNEFFPIFRSDRGIPYLDIGTLNYHTGKRIVSLLISKIFYLNYAGMVVQNIVFTREGLFSEEFIRIFLTPHESV